MNSAADQIAHVRQFCQVLLSRLTMKAGTASSETILLSENRLWGFRFAIDQFQVRWQLATEEVAVFEEGRFIERIGLSRRESQRAA